MRTITFEIPNDFNAEKIDKLIKMVDLKLIGIDNFTLNDEIVKEIKKGLSDIEKGNIVERFEVHQEAKKLCMK